MKKAYQLLDEYKKSQEPKKVSLSEELAPIFQGLMKVLVSIADKEQVAPVIENTVTPSEVAVTVESPQIDVRVPEINVPKQEINLDNYDYTSILIELKRSVDKLTKIVENRPKTWEVIRNNQGFIEKVNGV